MLKRLFLGLSLVVLALGMVAPISLLAQTIARPQTEKQKKANEAKLQKELASPYKKWLTDEVGWIISEEERVAFNRLETDDERQQFIEQFWLRRDPTPDTEENEFKEEHYRRIAWSNDRFASGIPGWKTDRGQVYIKFGAPDETEEHPTGGPGQRDLDEGGGQTTFFPYERWRYRYLDGVGSDVTLEFVDASMSNEYRLTWNPSDKDAMLRVPGAGLTLYEQMGMADKADRFQSNNGMMLGAGPLSGTAQMNMFDRMDRFVNVQKAPGIKFKDLDAAINSTIKYNLLPMLVRTDFVPITGASVLTSLTVQFDKADLQYKQKEGYSTASVEIRARLTTMTQRTVGTPVETIVKSEGLADDMGAWIKGKAIFNTKFYLQPGRYRLSVIARDTVGSNMSTYDIGIDVPHFEEDRLQTSSLILADQLEKVATRDIGKKDEYFIIGTTKVRPRMDETFKRTDALGVYMQMYNFEVNKETRKPEGSVRYEIVRNGSNEKVFDWTRDLSEYTGAAAQLILEEKLRLDLVGEGGLTPGDYTLKLTVTDRLRNETLSPSAKFKVI